MTKARAGSEMTRVEMPWVGRAMRRLEDPALVRGRGRFTADLDAAHFVRFCAQPHRVRPHRQDQRA
jgi:CO/xanthine dehydrogenase Mo-binding subunit